MQQSDQDSTLILNDADTLIAYFGYGSLVNLQTLQSGYVAAFPARLKGWRRHWQARGHGAANGAKQRTASPIFKTGGENLDTGSAEQVAWAASIRAAGFTGSITPGDLALLSVHREPAAVIGGMLVIDKAANLPALDERERLYDRVMINRDDLEFISNGKVLADVPADNLFLYVGRASPPGKPPLLQSYLDAVMTGFLDAHGEDGIAAFIASTIGFDREIIRDRKSPIYPRAIKISDDLANRFDHLLREAGVRFD